MTWRRVFRGRLYIRDSVWVLALAGAVLGSVLGLIDVHIDESVHAPTRLQYSASTASAVLAAIVGATAALTRVRGHGHNARRWCSSYSSIATFTGCDR